MGDRSRVIVIGAGIIGASIAWRLAQRGLHVTLLDAGTLGGEASWAGAGMLAPGGEFATRGPWTLFALESLQLYPEFVAELQGETEIPIDYRRCGALEIARTEPEWEALLARRVTQSEIGIRAEIVPGGLFYPDDALVDPRDITRALRCACEHRGVVLQEHTRVSEVRLSPDGVEVTLDGGSFAADAAVLAAGAWSGEIPVARGAEHFNIPATMPVRGHLLGYHLEPGSVGAILRHGHTYVMQRSNGFTIAGTSSEQAGFNRELDQGIVADIHARAAEVYPPLRDAAPAAAWLGFRPATADFNPVIGRLDRTALWLAYGHYRNGILFAPATAARVAAEIASA